MEKGMSSFLSPTAEREHREYLTTLKHRANIWKKNGYDIGKITEREILASRLYREERESLAELKHDVEMHELYFSSFSGTYMPCAAVKRSFGSENNFAYELSRYAEKKKMGFVCVYTDRSGRVGFCDSERLPAGATPRLAIDVSEHAYFRDYGFKKEKYLRAAIARLDFSRLTSAGEGSKS